MKQTSSLQRKVSAAQPHQESHEEAKQDQEKEMSPLEPVASAQQQHPPPPTVRASVLRASGIPS